MDQTTKRKRELVSRMADHLLAHGLAGSGLRALARSAGTSDRMLLYYFADKDELMAAVFEHLGQQIQIMLADNAPVERVDPDTLLEDLWAQLRGDELEQHSSLLIEMAAASVRQGEPYSKAARTIAAHFQDWIAERLDIDSEPERQKAAYLMMATLDGLALFQAFGLERP